MKRWFWRSETDFGREIEAHIALETDRLIAEGRDPREARALARRTFGNVAHACERFHETSPGAALLDAVSQDLRYAVRSFLRQPGLSSAVVFAIAVGIAANAALFSIFDGVLFRPLSFHESERIVVSAIPPGPVFPRLELLKAIEATPLLSDHARASVSQSIFQQDTEAAANLAMRAAAVSPNFFTFLGVEPILGRHFSDEDLALYGSQSVMIAFDVWRTLFGADPSLVGEYIELPGQMAMRQTRLLVGVLPPGFDFPQGTNVWIPVGTYNVRQPNNSSLPNYLRLTPGATIDHLRTAFPALTFTPLREHARPGGTGALAVLFAATGLLMLIAWVQVASLLISRSAGRAAELGIRLALGAGRWRLVRQFTAEGIVIATIALGIGWSLTPGLVRVVVWFLPAELTLGQIVSPDRRALAFASALSAVGVLIIALAPLEILRRTSPLVLIRRFGGVGLSATQMRTSLVVAQIAATAMLLYMAGLALRSFQHVGAVDLGFAADRVLAFRLPGTMGNGNNIAPELRAYSASQRQRFAQVLPALRALPGVVAAGGGRIPLIQDLFGIGGQLRPTRSASDRSDSTIAARVTHVTSGYIEAIGLRMRSGRGLEAGAIVNEAMARQLASFGPVIGQRVLAPSGAYEVAGIFADVVMSRADVPVDPEMLVPWTDQFFSSVIPSVVVRVRTREDEPHVIAGIQQMLASVFPAEPPRNVLRLTDEVRRGTSEHRGRTIVLGFIALMGLPLAVAGIAGALFHGVRERTRDIGVRLALGASTHDIRRRVIAQALVCVTAGLTIGLVTALAIGQWMSAYLYGIPAVDAWIIAGVVIALLAVAVGSAWWPAHRASTIDPSVVLREG